MGSGSSACLKRWQDDKQASAIKALKARAVRQGGWLRAKTIAALAYVSAF
jgi:hypothetical protein